MNHGLEKLLLAQPVKPFPTFYKTPILANCFSIEIPAIDLNLSQMNSVQINSRSSRMRP